MSVTIRCRKISPGTACGQALVSTAPISFLGGVDPQTGIVIEPGHPLTGKSIAGKVLVFPHGKGSTVGSYTVYRLAKEGMAPVAIINVECEPIVAAGAIISGIPAVDKPQCDIFARVFDGMQIMVNGSQGTITIDG